MSVSVSRAWCRNCRYQCCRCSRREWWLLPAAEFAPSSDSGNREAALHDPWPSLRVQSEERCRQADGLLHVIASAVYDLFVYFL